MKKPKMMMRFDAQQEANNKFQLYIYDDVCAQGSFDWNTWTYLESETSADFFRKQLEQIPDNAEIELFINSNGGSVKEGVGIYSQLKRHPAQKTAYIDGVAYSVAFLIPMACDKIIMGLGTTALLHNMWMGVQGNATQLRKAADDLDKMMESNRQIFLEKAGNKLTEDQLIQMLNDETILTPDQCLEYGLIDEVTKVAADPENLSIMQKANLEQLQQFIRERNAIVNMISTLEETCMRAEVAPVQTEKGAEPEGEKDPEPPVQKKSYEEANQFFNKILGGN